MGDQAWRWAHPAPLAPLDNPAPNRWSPGKIAATPAAGRLKGCPELTVEGDMREMAKTAAWSVSSCKPGNGVASLRDDSLDTYWQLKRSSRNIVETAKLHKNA
ncbi:hypothetical protein ZWY2020_018441 [Hordeum vulgare]|nr:hypothetical protein ZWY2020_018441 [Hordeum vulgare]